MKRERLKIVVRGAVQGVGFRPFVFRLSRDLALDGWVLNSPQGVFVEVEGARASLESFLFRLEKEKPPRAFIHSLESSFLDPVGYQNFEIRNSGDEGEKTALISPDIAVCGDCLREMAAPKDRRFRYPFINCTNCGPRFSIIEELPYDRAHTSMKTFEMCTDCHREYHDPLSRRFHAQPNACPSCGPQIQLWNESGAILGKRAEALRLAAEIVRSGQILALKGIGGFQLIVDANDDAAVARLRARKHREEKPFAVMFSALRAVREVCEVSPLEERILLSSESPIVLLRRLAAMHSPASTISPLVAPGNPTLGVMLPYTPLHHLLMDEIGTSIVATSGNLSDEPICIDEHDALQRLQGIADSFLVHNRPIIRQVDDSILRVMSGREAVLRRARGYAPLPISLPIIVAGPTVLGVGAHLKNAVALKVKENVFIGQHIGDLSTKEAFEAFTRIATELPRLYDVTPELVAHDLHPDYLSTKYARQQPARRFPVQHHWAHIVACMAENEIEPPALGIAWDGTGYGLDGTIWGGEFFRVGAGSWERVAHFRQFRLPGGDAAVREPRRSALGVLYAIFADDVWTCPEVLSLFSNDELRLLRTMMTKQLNSVTTSSVGRLFDAVAALLGLRTRSTFEGQAAMDLEFAASSGVNDSYEFALVGASPVVIDWEPTVRAMLRESEGGEATGTMAARFHNTLAEIIIALTRQIGEPRVVLSGGCFQNRYLTERAIDRLSANGFRPYWHQRVPPNDGGIALGQIVAATMMAGL